MDLRLQVRASPDDEDVSEVISTSILPGEACPTSEPSPSPSRASKLSRKFWSHRKKRKCPPAAASSAYKEEPSPHIEEGREIKPDDTSSGDSSFRDYSEMSGPPTYGTIKRGLKATTSKIINATSTVRRTPTLQHSVSLDRHVSGDRGDSRFVEGVSFKGKLIGVLEVSEARGDRMCQEALAELKMAVRAAGEHKQKIVISIAMDGIRLRDERSGDCLYHHPVHKISFIAQDMTDTRAFGYIFGSPDAGHKFFGIKTEKTASQVVIAMRDLFQVVFELKKKEIEKARLQLEEGKDSALAKETSYSGIFGENGTSGIISASLTSGAGGAIADLLDLQSELSSLQRGLSEITQRAQQKQEKEQKSDPFGDSFKPNIIHSKSPRITACNAPTPAPLAPPPQSGRTRHDSHHSSSSDPKNSIDFDKFSSNVDFKTLPGLSQQSWSSENIEDKFSSLKDLRRTSRDSFNEFSERKDLTQSSAALEEGISHLRNETFSGQWMTEENAHGSNGNIAITKSNNYDVFTELDPLGTGRSRPFIDKKDFFNNVRRPTRKLLRELGDGEDSIPGSPKTCPGIIPPEVSVLVASSSLYVTSSNSAVPSSHIPTSTDTTPMHAGSLQSHGVSNSFSPEDSFGSSDFRFHSMIRDGYDEIVHPSKSSFADFGNQLYSDSPRSQRSETSISMPDEPPPVLSLGAIPVALPPESFRDTPPSFSPSPSPGSPRVCHLQSPISRTGTELTVSVIPQSPKTLPRCHKFNRQSSYDGDWDAEIRINSRFPDEFTPPTPPKQHTVSPSPRPRPRSALSKQLSASSATLSFRPVHKRSDPPHFSSPEPECRPFPHDEFSGIYDEAPAPPPRPADSEPPPLPPKRQLMHVTKPPPRPPISSDVHYNYINECSSSPDEVVPPLPVPIRKPRHPELMSKPLCTPSRANKPLSARSASEIIQPIQSPPRSSSSLGSTRSVDLANTSLDQLAFALNVPIEKLAKMTVVELAASLAELQLQKSEETWEEEQAISINKEDESDGFSAESIIKEVKHSIPESDEGLFAKFDDHFDLNSSNVSFLDSNDDKAVVAPVSEDRYAVFRELTMVSKQKSVFDENFLTPQNSMEEEVSVSSSGTFKVNYETGDLRQDSMKSSFSDEMVSPKKNWEDREVVFEEGVTVFRSPEISEYENFEPQFEEKFEYEISSITSEKSTPINSPVVITKKGVSIVRIEEPSHVSPFTDDFSLLSKDKVATLPREKVHHSGGFFEDNFVPHETSTDKYAVFRKICESIQSSDYTFDDNFFEAPDRKSDSGFISNFEDCKFESLGAEEKETMCDLIVDGKHGGRNHIHKSSSLNLPHSSCDKHRKSPFDDDFTNRSDRYEVLREVDNDKDLGLETPNQRHSVSPYDESLNGSYWDPQFEETKSNNGSLHSFPEESGDIYVPQDLSIENESAHSASKLKSNMDGDNVAVTSQVHVYCKRKSSQLSGDSDFRQSPFDDNFVIEKEDILKDSELGSEEDPFKTKSNLESISAIESFADFDTAFVSSEEILDPSASRPEVKAKQEDSSVFENDLIFPEGDDTEFKISARYLSLEKDFKITDTVDIFRRNSDPFADDFFKDSKDILSSDTDLQSVNKQ